MNAPKTAARLPVNIGRPIEPTIFPYPVENKTIQIGIGIEPDSDSDGTKSQPDGGGNA